MSRFQSWVLKRKLHKIERVLRSISKFNQDALLAKLEFVSLAEKTEPWEGVVKDILKVVNRQIRQVKVVQTIFAVGTKIDRAPGKGEEGKKYIAMARKVVDAHLDRLINQKRLIEHGEYHKLKDPYLIIEHKMQGFCKDLMHNIAAESRKLESRFRARKNTRADLKEALRLAVAGFALQMGVGAPVSTLQMNPLISLLIIIAVGWYFGWGAIVLLVIIGIAMHVWGTLRSASKKDIKKAGRDLGRDARKIGKGMKDDVEGLFRGKKRR
jgi:hypothetical protein